MNKSHKLLDQGAPHFSLFHSLVRRNILQVDRVSVAKSRKIQVAVELSSCLASHQANITVFLEHVAPIILPIA